MIYLSGAVSERVLGRSDMGVMLTPMIGNRPDLSGTPWGADTGCFSRPDAYDTGRYLAWLDKLTPYHPTCLFATAPDRVGDAAGTLAIALPVLPLIRRRVPAALVAQDGLEGLPVPWHAFDCLFIGGSTRWKLSEAAYDLIAEAKTRGKWVHVGRVNSRRRFVAMAHAGCDSADGTYAAFNPSGCIARFTAWREAVQRQPSLLTVSAVDEEEKSR